LLFHILNMGWARRILKPFCARCRDHAIVRRNVIVKRGAMRLSGGYEQQTYPFRPECCRLPDVGGCVGATRYSGGRIARRLADGGGQPDGGLSSDAARWVEN